MEIKNKTEKNLFSVSFFCFCSLFFYSLFQFFDEKKHEEEDGDDEEEDGIEEEYEEEKKDQQEISKNFNDTQLISEEKKTEAKESLPKYDLFVDAALLNELEEAEKEAKTTVQTINKLKTRVTELLQKEKNTEVEAQELEEKNKELKAQMIMLEEKTKKIQLLIAQTNLFDKTNLSGLPLQEIYREDTLPKVVVCGVTENNIPKLVLCDEKQPKNYDTQAKIEVRKDINIPMVCTILSL